MALKTIAKPSITASWMKLVSHLSLLQKHYWSDNRLVACLQSKKFKSCETIFEFHPHKSKYLQPALFNWVKSLIFRWRGRSSLYFYWIRRKSNKIRLLYFWCRLFHRKHSSQSQPKIVWSSSWDGCLLARNPPRRHRKHCKTLNFDSTTRKYYCFYRMRYGLRTSLHPGTK